MRTVVIAFFVGVLFSETFSKKKQTIFKWDRIDICDVDEASPFHWNEISLQFNNLRGTLINGNFNLTQRVRAIKTENLIIRCSNKELLDSCEYFVTIKFKDTCFLFNQKNSFLSNYVDSCVPPFLCPLAKGVYTQKNASLDPSLFSFFPLEKWYWKGILKIFDTDTDQYYYTLCVEGQVMILFS